MPNIYLTRGCGEDRAKTDIRSSVKAARRLKSLQILEIKKRGGEGVREKLKLQHFGKMPEKSVKWCINAPNSYPMSRYLYLTASLCQKSSRLMIELTILVKLVSLFFSIIDQRDFDWNCRANIKLVKWTLT